MWNVYSTKALAIMVNMGTAYMYQWEVSGNVGKYLLMCIKVMSQCHFILVKPNSGSVSGCILGLVGGSQQNLLECE